MKIDHIGIAVKNMSVAREVYTTLLNKEPYKKELVEKDQVLTLFYELGESKLELLEASMSDSPIRKFIEKKGEGIHHIAFEVDDIIAKMKEYRAKGFSFVDEAPRLGADNKLIAFMKPKEAHGVLIELCQSIK